MAFYLTYNTLSTMIPQYINRYDDNVIANVPTFIMLAQMRIARDSKLLGLRRFYQGNLVVGVPLIVKPTRWLKTSTFVISINEPFQTGYNTKVDLFNREYSYVESYWPDATQTAQPEFYSDFEYNQWFISPTPDLAYPFSVSFYEIPVLIDVNTQTNFLTDNLPDVLLFACLMEASSYLKDVSLEQSWEQRYQRSLSSAQQQNIAIQTDSMNKRGE